MSMQKPLYPNPPTKITRGFSLLLEAFRYAEDSGCDYWDFAVEMHRLQAIGLNESDLRWITVKGYAEQAREITEVPGNKREFEPTGGWLLSEQSCFVLSKTGAVEAARLMALPQPVMHRLPANLDATAPVPHWNSDIRELHMYGQIVKRYKWQAVNQETVLSAFQEDGWPTVIDDPLPPKPEQDPRRRLHDTIKALNRNQVKPTIRFRGNGTGEGIRWEPLGSKAATPN